MRVVGDTAETAAKGRGNVALAIVGYSLLLIMLYTFTADEPVVKAYAGASSIATGAIDGWLSPVDPVAAIASKLGAGTTAQTAAVNAGPPLAQGLGKTAKPGRTVTTRRITHPARKAPSSSVFAPLGEAVAGGLLGG